MNTDSPLPPGATARWFTCQTVGHEHPDVTAAVRCDLLKARAERDELLRVLRRLANPVFANGSNTTVSVLAADYVAAHELLEQYP